MLQGQRSTSSCALQQDSPPHSDILYIEQVLLRSTADFLTINLVPLVNTTTTSVSSFCFILTFKPSDPAAPLPHFFFFHHFLKSFLHSTCWMNANKCLGEELLLWLAFVVVLRWPTGCESQACQSLKRLRMLSCTAARASGCCEAF